MVYPRQGMSIYSLAFRPFSTPHRTMPQVSFVGGISELYTKLPHLGLRSLTILITGQGRDHCSREQWGLLRLENLAQWVISQCYDNQASLFTCHQVSLYRLDAAGTLEGRRTQLTDTWRGSWYHLWDVLDTLCFSYLSASCGKLRCSRSCTRATARNHLQGCHTEQIRGKDHF